MFIRSKKPTDILGKKVKLLRDIKVFAGTFKQGSIVTLSEYDEITPSRGYGIVDEEGNRAIECGFDFFEAID